MEKDKLEIKDSGTNILNERHLFFHEKSMIIIKAIDNTKFGLNNTETANNIFIFI